MSQIQKIKVGDLVAQTLEKLNIKHIFGITGAGNVHLFDSIARHGFTEIICVHHEQAACMAMQTYYRTSGRLAACLLTTGGGSTNGVTGVVSAWADSIPGIVIAGNEHSKHVKFEDSLRMWGVQGYDSVDMVRKVTKYSSRVTDPRFVCYELEKASHIALEGRPGPVWIEIPMDIQSTFIDPIFCMSFTPPPKKTYKTDFLLSQIDLVVEKLKTCERPMFWFGNGIRLAGAEHKIKELLNITPVPSLVSWAGIDMINSDHELVYGRAGVYGQRCANFVLQNSDYVLAIGTRLAIPQIGYDLSELARSAEIDVVDIDPLEAKKLTPRIRQPIISDAREFLDILIEKVKDNIQPKEKWIEKCNSYRVNFPWVGKEHNDEHGFINSYRFMEKLNLYFKPDQIVVTDMGTALLSGHQTLKFKDGQRLMTSTGLGEMGYGLPAAIGASFATNRGEVMCLNCDGGMMMNLQELQTIDHHRLPIKIFVFNNDGYLMIKHTQRNLFKGSKVGSDKASGVSCPDFDKVGKAFNMPTYQIRTWEDCEKLLPIIQDSTGPLICEVFMYPEQFFVPKLGMVARDDGTLVSSPLEDLGPLLPREILKDAMIIEMHEKSMYGVK